MALLDGVTVLDLASVGPAARASRWLADYGARVVKVSPPPGRAGTQIVPPYYAYGGHRGMERVNIDLKADAGRAAFLRLAATADVVIESFRPGAADKLGIGYEAVRAGNPGIIYCSTTGYGQEGPKAQWAGHDLNYLAVAGYLDCSGRTAEAGPALPGATVADSAAGGLHAVAAVLAALVGRAASGEGMHLDVSVTDGVVALMSLAIDEHLATGVVPGPGHNILTGRYACYDVYPCADGRWVAVGAIEPRFFANLCRALGCEDLAGRQLDDDAQAELRAALRAAFGTRPRDEWVEILAPADCCVSPVATVAEVVADEHFRARDVIVTAERPGHDPLEQVGFVLAGMDRDQAMPVVRDPLSTDTDALLGAAGYDAAALAALREQGTVA